MSGKKVPAPAPEPEPAPAEVDPVRPHVEERGELALTLDGHELVMRPSYEAIVGFETSTGKGLIELTQDALNSRMAISTAAQIVAECVRAWGRATNSASARGVNAVRIAELILESSAGYRGALGTVAGMLALASTGAYTASGELKPTTTMTTEPAPVVG